MALIIWFLALVAAGDVLAYLVGLFVEHEWGGYTSLVVFLAMYFITLWVAWRIAVWMTTPKLVPDSTGAGGRLIKPGLVFLDLVTNLSPDRAYRLCSRSSRTSIRPRMLHGWRLPYERSVKARRIVDMRHRTVLVPGIEPVSYGRTGRQAAPEC